MDSFSLDIDLGNAAMQTREDVAGALRDAARAVENSAVSHTEGILYDGNGNNVGAWGFDWLADKRPEKDALPYVTAAIEGALDGAAEGFDENPEAMLTSREVADALRAGKPAAIAAARETLPQQEADAVTVNRHVLAALCFLLEAGQHARAERFERGAHPNERLVDGLRGSGNAFRQAGRRIDSGDIPDADVSETLDRIILA